MKSITLAVFLLISSSAAIAQQQGAVGGSGLVTPPVPVTAPDPLTIKVTRERLQLIGQGVMKLPYETAAPILVDLQAQLNALDEAAKKGAEVKVDVKPGGGAGNPKEPEKTKK